MKKKTKTEHKRSRCAPHKATFSELLAGIVSDLDDLHEEIDGWLQGLPENLQSGSKADELQSCLDSLEAAKEAAESAESSLGELKIASIQVCYTQDERKGRNSRADRAANINSIVSALHEMAEEGYTKAVEEKHEDEESLGELVSALRDLENELCNISFPGMY